jgi:hypothetical protein
MEEFEAAPRCRTVQCTRRGCAWNPLRRCTGAFVAGDTLPPFCHSTKRLRVLVAIVTLAASLLALPPVAAAQSSTCAASSRMPPPGDYCRMLRLASLSSTGLRTLRGGGNEDRDQLTGELPCLIQRSPQRCLRALLHLRFRLFASLASDTG